MIIEKFIEIAFDERKTYSEDEEIFLDKLSDYPHILYKIDNYFFYDFFLLPITYSEKQVVKDMAISICSEILETQMINFENWLKYYIVELIDLNKLLKRAVLVDEIQEIIHRACNFDKERIEGVYYRYEESLRKNESEDS